MGCRDHHHDDDHCDHSLVGVKMNFSGHYDLAMAMMNSCLVVVIMNVCGHYDLVVAMMNWSGFTHDGQN